VAPPELVDIDRRRDIRIEGIHMLDRVDTRQRGIEGLLDPGGGAVGPVEDLPRGRKASLRVNERSHRLLPLLVLHGRKSAGKPTRHRLHANC
jgi:hypothetical protein